MKKITFLFLLVCLNLNSQITKISSSETYEVGEIFDCTLGNKDWEKCPWLARLIYQEFANERVYTLKYRREYGNFGEDPKIITSQISFKAKESEINYLYNEIKEWIGNKNKSETINFMLGKHTLQVFYYRVSMDEYLSFSFKKKKDEELENNWYSNGFTLRASSFSPSNFSYCYDLKKLLGIKP